jgi:hypothetical protein
MAILAPYAVAAAPPRGARRRGLAVVKTAKRAR